MRAVHGYGPGCWCQAGRKPGHSRRLKTRVAKQVGSMRRQAFCSPRRRGRVFRSGGALDCRSKLALDANVGRARADSMRARYSGSVCTHRSFLIPEVLMRISLTRPSGYSGSSWR